MQFKKGAKVSGEFSKSLMGIVKTPEGNCLRAGPLIPVGFTLLATIYSSEGGIILDEGQHSTFSEPHLLHLYLLSGLCRKMVLCKYKQVIFYECMWNLNKATGLVNNIVQWHFLVRVFYYSHVRCYRWGKLGEEYTGHLYYFLNFLWVYTYFKNNFCVCVEKKWERILKSS